MNYPIFNSFTNQIENQLTAKKIPIKTFKTWHEDHINAAGLEIIIDARDGNKFIKEVCINFDWDRFRETVLAQQLEGLSTHPLLQKSNLKSVTVSPKIDIEMSWVLDEKNAKLMLLESTHSDEMESVGQWMEKISKQVNDLLAREDSITRWHIEIEGNHGQKYLSAARLISYFQYSLSEITRLNETHSFIKRRMEELMVNSKKVRRITDEALSRVASQKAS